MSTVGRVFGNTMALSGVQGIRILLALGLTIYVARFHGPEWLGRLALLLAYINIFQIVSEFGLPRLVTREVARAPSASGSYAWAALTVQLAWSVFAMALMATLVWVMGYAADTTRMLYLATLALPPYAVFAVAGALLQARERMELLTLSEATSSIAQFVAIVLLLQSGHGVEALAMVKIVGGVLMASMACAGVLWIGAWGRPEQLWRIARILLSRASTFFLFAILGSILFRLDILVVTQIRGEADAGIYNAANQLVKVFLVLGLAYGDAIFPALARFYTTAEDSFGLAIRRSLHYGALVLLPVSIATAVLAPGILKLIYGGNQFTAAEPALIWLAVMLFPFFVYTVISRALMAADRQNVALRISLQMVGIMVVCQITMTHLWGVTGTAIAASVSALAGATLGWYHARDVIGSLHFGDRTLRQLAAMGGLTLALWVLRDSSIWLVAPVGVAVYLALVLTLKVLAQEDLLLLRHALAARLRPPAA